MAMVKLCDYDQEVIPAGEPFITVGYLQVSDGHASRFIAGNGIHYFHTGLCAAGWLGRLCAQNDVPQGTPETSPPLPGVSILEDR